MSTMPDGQIQAAADAKASTMHHTPVKPMERVVSPEDIERGERMERRRSAEPGFWRFFAELNAGLILTAFAIVAFKTPNHFGRFGHSVYAGTDASRGRLHVDSQHHLGGFGIHIP